MDRRRLLMGVLSAEVGYSGEELRLKTHRRLEQLRLLALLGLAACLVVGYQVTAHEAQLRRLQELVPGRFGRAEGSGSS